MDKTDLSKIPEAALKDELKRRKLEKAKPKPKPKVYTREDYYKAVCEKFEADTSPNPSRYIVVYKDHPHWRGWVRTEDSLEALAEFMVSQTESPIDDPDYVHNPPIFLGAWDLDTGRKLEVEFKVLVTVN